MKYKITHLITADFVAEIIVDESEINIRTNDLKEFNIINQDSISDE